MHKFANPVFIVGPPRSGTTYLQMLLSEQYIVTTFPETHFFMNVPQMLKQASDGYNLDINLFLEYAKNKMDLEISAEDINKILNLKNTKSKKEILRSLFEYIIGLLGGVNNEERLMEKTPCHCMMMPLIREVYPDAFFVAIIRHPLDTISSQLVKLSGINPETTIRSSVYQWARETTTIIDECKKYPDSVMIVRYNQILDRDLEEVDKIARRCGFTKRKRLMKRDEIKEKITLKYETWKSDILKSKIKNSGRKLLRMSYSDRLLIDVNCAEQTKFFGFSTSTGLSLSIINIYIQTKKIFKNFLEILLRRV
jgi:hypothetical protein